MEPRELAPGIFGLGSELVNWYLIEDGGRLTAVDAGLPGFAERLPGDLARLGLRVADVDAVVLTHSDADHTGLAPVLRDAGARVLIHAADEATLSSPGPKTGDGSPAHMLANLWRPLTLLVLGHNLRHGGAHPARVEGAETFAAGDVLDVPGRLIALHTPGHNPGHCALLAPARRVLFCGDALITHRFATKGRGPQLMPRFTNVDTEQALASLDAIEAVDGQVDVLLLGHGRPWHGGARAAVASARAAAGAAAGP